MPATIVPLQRLNPESAVTDIRGVGADQQKRLERLGIRTVRDLLYHLPFRYEDTRELTTLRDLQPGAEQTARVRVRHVTAPQRSPRKGIVLVKAAFEDETGTAGAVWFGRQYVERHLHVGDTVVVHGKVELDRDGIMFRNPEFEPARGDQRHVGTLAPVYHETYKLSSRQLRNFLEPLLYQVIPQLQDVLPPDVRAAEHLMSVGEALRAVHAPDSREEANEARERIAFEELFLLHLAAERARHRRVHGQGVVIPYDVEVARAFTRSLPFTLTGAQRVAAHQILTDMAEEGPMNRLLQGDVGSGKTVVAALAALMAHHAGRQVAVMAPTEILARQHASTLDTLLTPHGLPPRLLVGSTGERARREIIAALAAGHDALIVGTHALIEDDVVMENLGLAVVDEQHRFGVAQRQQLRQKSGVMPNFLAMTATPIPRSLTLTVYGDVDVSELHELPPGRIPVQTQVVSPLDREAANAFVREQVLSGAQVFVICPLIEESDKLGAKSAIAEHDRLQKVVFPDLRVDLLHGRMPSREKEERMGRFVAGETDILVSTSVVEVGVDVANASVMVIEGAERFGLAQLHQFRGRVGRGTRPSYCLLFEGGVDAEGSRRLHFVATHTSGFELAEEDLRERGGGDVAGLRQHGLPEMQAADLLDMALSQRALDAARRVLDEDPALTAHPPLTAAMERYRDVFDLD
ncbi:MAG TPA: ATP-dependent DNA helicase RecG [Candidatus Dormibacteraeota bacterium]